MTKGNIWSIIENKGYFNSKNWEEADPLIDRIQKQIAELKQNRNLEARYMQFQEMLREERTEGRVEGRMEGHDNIMRLIAAMKKDGRKEDILRLDEDLEFLEEMLKHYQII